MNILEKLTKWKLEYLALLKNYAKSADNYINS